jgi:hypothetical protein
MTPGVVFSKAKTVVAAIGATCTAILVALAVVQTVLADGKLDITEYSTLIGAAVTLVGTVYGVWRTENKVLQGKVIPEVTSENRY